MTTLKGGCLCGAVRYQYQGVLSEVALCHCTLCRKAQGGLFATNAPINEAELIIEGDSYIREYQESDTKTRAFCSQCGSPIYSKSTKVPGIVRLRVGTLESDLPSCEKYHIYVESRANWEEINDGFPQFPESKTS